MTPSPGPFNSALSPDRSDERIEKLVSALKKSLSDIAKIPLSTYRLQFNQHFRFVDATRIVPYLAELGISHLYASPYLQARSGSLHGYDISNHNKINTEIGSESEHAELVEALKGAGMKHILDIVPNHMGIEERSNRWWIDVLENGQNSPYAYHFDIDWNPIKKELRGKVLLPVLGDQYGKVLENSELRLIFSDGGFWVTYYEHQFPISPRTYPQLLRRRLEKLESELENDPESLQEFEGITLALLNLPEQTHTDRKRIAEERRQVGWIKSRLAKLYQSNTKIRRFVDRNISLFNGKKGDPRSFDPLDDLLNRQAYRLANWRVAGDEVNYRRFFDVNQLASISMEREEVFEETHRLIFRLIQQGKLDGLRIDHPDGLFDPLQYLRRLQRRCFALKALAAYPDGSDEAQADLEKALEAAAEEILKNPVRTALPFYIVVEKILTKRERLPERWPVDGTVGYEFTGALNGLFVKSENRKPFDDIYSDFIGSRIPFSDIVYERKKLIMNTSLAGEINVLAYQLNKLSEKDRLSRDFTLYSLRDAIREIIACFPIYRTYISKDESVEEHDRMYIGQAIGRAKQRSPMTDISIFDYLKRILLLQYPEYFSEQDRGEQLAFVQRFQQCTGPIMAKGLEDTAFYIYNRLISLNEVGGDPETFGLSPAEFHRQNEERFREWTASLLATSTHDAKRSEDVRARINVLSEIPDLWRQAVGEWSQLNRSKKTEVEGELAPDPNNEYLLYQTLLGAWPLNDLSREEFETFKGRIREYMRKASMEAKVKTSWINPNQRYDEALSSFIDRILDRSESNAFLQAFQPLQKKVAHFGIYNSLSQLLLKITSPGVPDFYQGNELFDFSLVDPDNRRAVDYTLRMEMLSALKKAFAEAGPAPASFIEALFREKENGKVKLYVTWRALSFRRAHPSLFLKGVYLALEGAGKGKEQLCAFSRRREGEEALVVAPRLLVSLAEGGEETPVGKLWEGTDLLLDERSAGRRYLNHFTMEETEVESRDGKRVLPLSKLFASFPLALLTPKPE